MEKFLTNEVATYLFEWKSLLVLFQTFLSMKPNTFSWTHQLLFFTSPEFEDFLNSRSLHLDIQNFNCIRTIYMLRLTSALHHIRFYTCFCCCICAKGWKNKLDPLKVQELVGENSEFNYLKYSPLNQCHFISSFILHFSIWMCILLPRVISTIVHESLCLISKNLFMWHLIILGNR